MSINLTAPVNKLGYGIVGLNIALAMERRGDDPALWPLGGIEADEVHHAALRRMMSRQAHYDPLAPSLRVWHQFDLAQHVGKGLHAAYPFFELDRFKPAEKHHLKAQDVVFATSEWAAEILSLSADLPSERVLVVNPGVDHAVFRPLETAKPAGLAGNTVFLSIGKWETRKGHDVLYRAFRKAFGPTDNVRLVMHCHNPCLGEHSAPYNQSWERLYRANLGEQVVFTAGRLQTHEDVAHLMSQVDCGVFPSRGEGWNLEAAEMLAMAKSVILTDYSAHRDFATKDNSLLIQVTELEDAHDGIWFKANDPSWEGNPGLWAALGDCQIDQMVEHLRSIHKKKQAGDLRPNDEGHRSMQAFTWDNAARQMVTTLK
jgi:glycosyltransferase involved in cell wall biosynthesis